MCVCTNKHTCTHALSTPRRGPLHSWIYILSLTYTTREPHATLNREPTPTPREKKGTRVGVYVSMYTYMYEHGAPWYKYKVLVLRTCTSLVDSSRGSFSLGCECGERGRQRWVESRESRPTILPWPLCSPRSQRRRKSPSINHQHEQGAISRSAWEE